MLNEKANYKVHFNKLCKHIAHDLQKGLTNQLYTWQNVRIETGSDNSALVRQNGLYSCTLSNIAELGTEQNDYKDNQINGLTNISGIAKITQVTLTNSLETKQMKKQFDAQNIANEAANTLKTVGSEITSSAITSAKMEAGENILLAMRNLVLKRAGFLGKVKFKLMPVALDVAVTAMADVLSVELMPNSNKAKLARECLNLAMTKEVISTLPVKDFTEAMTGGSALANVKSLIDINNKD